MTPLLPMVRVRVLVVSNFMLELFFSTVYETAHADIIESWKTEEKAGICTAVATFSQLTAKQCRLINIHSGKFVFGILVSTVPF